MNSGQIRPVNSPKLCWQSAVYLQMQLQAPGIPTPLNDKLRNPEWQCVELKSNMYLWKFAPIKASLAQAIKMSHLLMQYWRILSCSIIVMRLGTFKWIYKTGERQWERAFSREVEPQPCEFASNSDPVMGLWISQFSANRQIMKRN